MIPRSIRTTVIVAGAVEIAITALYTIFVFGMSSNAHTQSQVANAYCLAFGWLIITLALLMLIGVARNDNTLDWPIYALGGLCLLSPALLVLSASM